MLHPYRIMKDILQPIAHHLYTHRLLVHGFFVPLSVIKVLVIAIEVSMVVCECIALNAGVLVKTMMLK